MAPRKKRRFEPTWQDEDAHPDGLCLPADDDGERTPHPLSPPGEVARIVSTTYKQTIQTQEPFPPALPNSINFALFPSVPIELRLMIWRETLPGPRIVEVLYNNETGVCKSYCPIPIALHVNKESRSVALKSYELCFSTTKSPPMIYFNFEIDEFYAGAGNFTPPEQEDPVSTFFKSLPTSDVSRIRSLAIDSSCNSLFWNDGGENNGDSTPPHERYGLISLERQTIISQLEDFDGDMVLTEVKDNPGEFQVWTIDEEGEPKPWELPIDRPVFEYDVEISHNWRDIENEKSMKDGIRLMTIRYVSTRRLMSEERWMKRARFLHGTFWVQDVGCLYSTNEIAKTLINLNVLQPVKYLEMATKISEGWDEGIDPVCMYLCQTTCVCGIGHKHRLSIHSEEAIAGVDIRTTLLDMGIELEKADEWA